MPLPTTAFCRFGPGVGPERSPFPVDFGLSPIGPLGHVDNRPQIHLDQPTVASPPANPQRVRPIPPGKDDPRSFEQGCDAMQALLYRDRAPSPLTRKRGRRSAHGTAVLRLYDYVIDATISSGCGNAANCCASSPARARTVELVICRSIWAATMSGSALATSRLTATPAAANASALSN
jgi:hypothetical protein